MTHTALGAIAACMRGWGEPRLEEALSGRGQDWPRGGRDPSSSTDAGAACHARKPWRTLNPFAARLRCDHAVKLGGRRVSMRRSYLLMRAFPRIAHLAPCPDHRCCGQPALGQGAPIHAGAMGRATRADTRGGAPARIVLQLWRERRHRGIQKCRGSMTGLPSPLLRFAARLTAPCARLGADVDRYYVMDLHHLLFAGFPAHRP